MGVITMRQRHITDEVTIKISCFDNGDAECEISEPSRVVNNRSGARSRRSSRDPDEGVSGSVGRVE